MFFFSGKKSIVIQAPPKVSRIDLNTWYGHFKSLITSGYDVNGNSQYADLNGLNTNVNEDYLFDSTIFEEEIIDSVGYLRLNKSSGGYILPSHIDYGIDFFYFILVNFLIKYLFLVLFQKRALRRFGMNFHEIPNSLK